MPRPHIPHHLSLRRIKSSTNSNHNNHQPSNGSSAPSTPPTNSRSGSPTRSYTAGPTSADGGRSGDHKGMGLVLRVQVMKARDLAAKDKSGTSDPYLVLTLGDAKEATSVVSKTLNPEWNQTFEFPVTTADAALLEAVCWDKDRFKKDYMGEFDVVLEEMFQNGQIMQEAKWFKLESRRSGKKKKKNANVTGEVLLKFTMFDPTNPAASDQQIMQKFTGLVADDGNDDEDDDDSLSRMESRDLDDVSEEDDDDDDEKDPSDETDAGPRTPSGTLDEKAARRREKKIRKLKRKNKLKAYEFSGMSDVAGVLFLEINRVTDLPPEKNSTRTTFDMDPFVVTSLGKKTYRTKVVNHNLNPVFDEKLVFQVQNHEVNYSLGFAVVDRDKFSGNDFVGTTNFPVDKIKRLAPEADPDTGLYRLPDPDPVAESEREPERRRRFRLPMSRSNSSTNISRNTSSSNLTKLTRTTSSESLKNRQLNAPSRPGFRRLESENDVLDHSANHRPAPTSAPSYASAQSASAHSNSEAQQSNGSNGEDGDPDLKPYELPLELKKKERWENKHNPTLYIRAKYLPYRALRQQFWRAMLKQYDADDSGKIDKVELVTMLDSLGSTLHNSTIDGFFARWKKQNHSRFGDEKVLTVDQAVMCLEEQLMKSRDTQSYLHRPHWHRHSSEPSTKGLSVPGRGTTESSPEESPGGGTPYLGGADRSGKGPSNLNPTSGIPALEISDLSEGGENDSKKPATKPQTPNSNVVTTAKVSPSLSREDSWGQDSEADLYDDAADDGSQEEHVVAIQECPICHMPRLDSRGRKGRRRGNTDADIITHIATCASSDWRAVNNLVMAGFVTSSQAQRKWYSKVVSKIGYGGYKLGANSANILVQDRITGMINEERMSVYVRLGIRLLYKGLKSRDMENRRIRKLLRSLSFKQGRKYDDPASTSQIAGFINFHQLDMGEVLLPTHEFKNFNEFFYRKLKPTARPCSAPDDSHIIVSPADCRSVVFNRMDEAQRIWVKGREFSMERLLGNAYPNDAKRYRNGALGIMRLAPQDYHRFHIPVDGIMGEPKLIEGEYYTVNPMAIRSALDVYGENIRVCVPIDSVSHGRVMVVCVGAMMVGSTVITRKPGERVKRAEELGYFKFGGSTLLLLFEPGVMKFDDDLIANSNGALETLIRVGMSIGHTPNHEPYQPDMPKENPTDAEKQEAKRRIEGSLAPSKGVDPVAMGS
ncbi:phosphatidylserine decarboxylase [Vermiconidia calcicola]|uniref:Phosphatidylserine decarboxylase n=1 Tax=Vermiconidia calcicola TaxID=1690605 RepID=A0ACC3NUG1_9PEZI|nr:phosphatidylserine decarboxylase [Vermiconidia calcicola]